jgi:hypothetical protein
VLGLIGISGGSFILSKGIGMAKGTGKPTDGDQSQRAGERKVERRWQDSSPRSRSDRGG